MKLKKKIALLWITLISIFVMMTAGQAVAANEMSIMTINGSILPEYDNKYLLELYTVTMTNTSDKPFSGELTWRMPKGHLKEFVSKNEDLDKNQTIGKIRSFSDYDELYWKPNKPIPPKGIVNWHIEYYNTTAIQGETDKNFNYSFKQPYKIDLASLVILQPTKATNFQLVPAPENTKDSQQGRLYGYSIKDGKPNEEKIVKVNYTKSDPNPSFSSNSNSVAIGDNTGTIQGGTTASTATNKTMMYLLIALIIIFAAAAIILINKNQVQDKISAKDSTKEYDDENSYDFHDSIENATYNDAGMTNKEETSKNRKIKDKLKQEMLEGKITEEEYYDKLADLE